MISKEQLERNRKKFKDTNEKYGIFTKELEEFLGEDFYLAPASTSLDQYGCYPGGLLDHLLRVCKYSIYLNGTLPEENRIKEDKIIRVTFLSQIGKTFLFKSMNSEWHRNTLGKMYEYNDRKGVKSDGKEEKMVRLHIGERSVYYALMNGVKLSEDEFQAIIDSDKKEDESNKWEQAPLTHIIKMGFEMALIDEKITNKTLSNPKDNDLILYKKK